MKQNSRFLRSFLAIQSQKKIKQIFTTLLVVICAVQISFLAAQNTPLSNERVETCGTDALHLELQKNNPRYAEQFSSINERYADYVKKRNTNSLKSSATTVELPVVFHFIGVTPFSLDERNGVIADLNNKFSGELGTESCPGFSITNTNIQFCLAQTDATSNPIDYSIEYENPISEPVTTDIEDAIIISNVIQSTDNFNTTDYINVYIVEDIEQVAGYAFLPAAHGQSFDGIYVERSQILPYGGTLTHEMGHYLGLFHTFGICDPFGEELVVNDPETGEPTYPCSCDNDNCLFNGDMVCDTPPARRLNGACGINTCNTDHLASIYDNLMPTVDMIDDKTNYMDYSPYRNHFTEGQGIRMCSMVDPEIGPRNSLLNSNACTAGCDLGEDCLIAMNEIMPVTQIFGEEYPNTLVLDQGNTTHTFTGIAENCTGGDTYSWEIENLDNNTIVFNLSTSGLSVTPTLTSVGNYRISFNISSSSNPLCSQTTTLDFQVVQGVSSSTASCPENINFNNNWTNWTSISGPISNPTTIENDIPNNYGFEIYSSGMIPTSDENFGGTPFPNNVSDVIRVGPTINNNEELTPGQTYQLEYTFIPTEENSKIKVWYLGMFHDEAVLHLTCSYRVFLPPTGSTFLNNSSNLSSNNWNYPLNDIRTYTSLFDFASYTEVPKIIEDETIIYNQQNEWQSKILDFSEFVCNGSEITIKIKAETNTANNDEGKRHAYSYFGFENCLPGISGDFSIDLPNVQLGCTPIAENELLRTCFTIDIPEIPLQPELSSSYSNYYENLIFPIISVEYSNDGINFTNLSSNSNSIEYYSVINSGYNPEIQKQDNVLNICFIADITDSHKYFKVTYNTSCGLYEDTFTAFYGFYHTVEPCLDSWGGGEVLEPIIRTCDPIGTLITAEEPCWQTPEMTPDYKWQYLNGPNWMDIENTNTESLLVQGLIIPGLNPPGGTNELFRSRRCNFFRRMIEFEDPYCRVPAWLPSDTINIVNRIINSAYRENGIETNNPCANEELYLTFEEFGGPPSNSSFECDPDFFNTIDSEDLGGTATLYFMRIRPGEPDLDVTSSLNLATSSALTFDLDDNGYLLFQENLVYNFIPGTFQDSDNVRVFVQVNTLGCSRDIAVNFGFGSFVPVVITPFNSGIITGSPSQACFGSSDAENLIFSNDGFMNDNSNSLGYYWEYDYSEDFLNPIEIISNPEEMILNPAELDEDSPFVYIRRVYNGNSICAGPGYSNVITVENSCFGTPDCTENLVINIATIDCATNASGEVLYSFHFAIESDIGLDPSFGMTSPVGEIIELTIDDTGTPGMIFIDGIISIFNPDEPIVIFSLDFENPIICSLVIKLDRPNCGCIIDNLVIDYPDCIEPDIEFCIPIEFDYYGSIPALMNFSIPSTSNFIIASFENTELGTPGLTLGHNLFELCLIYEGECTIKPIDLDFTGSIITKSTTVLSPSKPTISLDPIKLGINTTTLTESNTTGIKGEIGTKPIPYAPPCQISGSTSIPCCDDDCTEELDVVLQDISCAADEDGNLVYEFDLRIWDPNGIADPLVVNSPQGIISNLIINTDFMPNLPELVQVTGTITTVGSLSLIYFNIDFNNATLCDVEVYDKKPNCECAISDSDL